jgi:uncharacterized membrane protein
MSQNNNNLTDVQMDSIMGNLLRTGVILSAVVVIFGGAVYLLRHGHEVPQYTVFRGEPSDLRTFIGIYKDIFAGRGRGLIQLGLLILMATPVARVLFSVVAFGIRKDITYVIITLIVLAILIYSIAGAFLFH